MNIELCDMCGKEIDRDWQNPKGYIVGRSSISRYALCETCGKPLAKLIKKLESRKDQAISAHIPTGHDVS